MHKREVDTFLSRNQLSLQSSFISEFDSDSWIVPTRNDSFYQQQQEDPYLSIKI